MIAISNSMLSLPAGSMMLHKWQRLATPRLGCFLATRPGVQNKGERPLDFDGQVYNLSDLEEDSHDTLDSSAQGGRVLTGEISHDLYGSHDNLELIRDDNSQSEASVSSSHPASLSSFTRRYKV